MTTAVKKTLPVLTTIGLFLLSNLKWIMAALKLSKFATLISMLISIGAYGLFYGWKFGIALVYLIFVHEMGHLIAAKMKGIKTTPAVFIPFMGAVIGMKEMPKNAKDEAFLAYGGPLLGTLAFVPAIPLYYLTNDSFWMLVIAVGALINLFNLLPVSPLDGGRIVTVLSTKIWALGLIFLAVYSFYSPSPIIILVLIVGVFTWWGRAREGFKEKILRADIEEYETLKKDIDILEEEEKDKTYDTLEELTLKRERFKEMVKEKELLEEKTKRKFFIPIIHDSLRLEKERNITKVDAAIVKVLLYSRAQGYEEKKLEVNQMIENRLKDIEKLQTYYQTDTKTKVITLVLYLLLAAVLSGTVYYALKILENTPI